MKSSIEFYFKYFFKYILLLINRPLQKTRITKSYITCAGNSDGAGAQAHAILSTILFAKLYGLEYIHTPFMLIEHNHTQNVEWEQMWEDFFFFGLNRQPISHLSTTYVEKKKLIHPLLLYKKPNTLYVVRNCHQCIDLIPDSYSLILKEIRTHFKQLHFGNINQANQVKKISIHIRRGDVLSQGVNASRFTESNIIITLTDIITTFFIEHNIQYEIDIYSQGGENDFIDFKKSKTNFKINYNEFETFKGLVKSDILIMAKSSFSYTAALFSEGLIFYDEFWHKPLKSWIKYNDVNINMIRSSLEKYFGFN
jgi:hypothetical protein